MPDNKKRILLLDDDYDSMYPFKLYLEEVHGFQVDLSAEQKVIERLRDEKFDLICIDYMIHPKSLNADQQEVKNIHFENVNWQRTGLEFLARLRRGEFGSLRESATGPETPVIMLSAVADPAQEMANGRVGRNIVYREKPFDPEELAELIHQLL